MRGNQPLSKRFVIEAIAGPSITILGSKLLETSELQARTPLQVRVRVEARLGVPSGSSVHPLCRLPPCGKIGRLSNNSSLTLRRLHDNKRFVQVYDYVDHYAPMLSRMYERRLKGYSTIGMLSSRRPPPPHESGAQ
jgi:hypothetical protein